MPCWLKALARPEGRGSSLEGVSQNPRKGLLPPPQGWLCFDTARPSSAQASPRRAGLGSLHTWCLRCKEPSFSHFEGGPSFSHFEGGPQGLFRLLLPLLLYRFLLPLPIPSGLLCLSSSSSPCSFSRELFASLPGRSPPSGQAPGCKLASAAADLDPRELSFPLPFPSSLPPQVNFHGSGSRKSCWVERTRLERFLLALVGALGASLLLCISLLLFQYQTRESPLPPGLPRPTLPRPLDPLAPPNQSHSPPPFQGPA